MKIFRKLLNIHQLQAAVEQWVRALVPQAEGRVFESQPRQTYVVNTGSDRSTTKRSAIDVSVTIKFKLQLKLSQTCHNMSKTFSVITMNSDQHETLH